MAHPVLFERLDEGLRLWPRSVKWAAFGADVTSPSASAGSLPAVVILVRPVVTPLGVDPGEALEQGLRLALARSS